MNGKMEEMRGMFLNLGYNMWSDVPVESWGNTKKEDLGIVTAADHLRCDGDVWQRVTDRMAQLKFNTVVIDLGEGCFYPSHPELAVKGTWSVDKMRKEIARLRGLGIEPIPKINFSTSHDTWLKEYGRMVSTPDYYKVCADVIRDVCEIFDRPRFLHLGYDEESFGHQSKYAYGVVRKGDLWWHDFLFFVKIVEKEGVRPWIWSDYIWGHKDEFLAKMPKSVLQSNWYYGSGFNTVRKDGKPNAYVAAYEWLDKAGFEQVPTGSNWSCDVNFSGTVKFCDTNCDKKLLKGYMMAPWTRTFAIHEEKSMQAIDQMEAVIKARA